MANALVIDDNRDNADAVVRLLTLFNVKGQAAYGARAAMLTLKQATPDIVFLDINMPGVDGFEVYSYLRRFPQLQDVPIVFVTSDDQAETAGRIRKTGALLVIYKPATFESIELALKKAGILR